MSKKVIISALFIAALALVILQARQTSQLREHVQTLEQERAQLTARVEELKGEAGKPSIRQPTAAITDAQRANQNLAELLRLRSEVTRLQNDSADLAQRTRKVVRKRRSASLLPASGLTARTRCSSSSRPTRLRASRKFSMPT